MLIFYRNVDFILKGDINFLYKEFTNILLELNEDYLDHNKNEEESIVEKILNK